MMEHPDGRKTVVPVHGNEELGPGLLHKILSSAGITRQELLRLLKS
jgi:predicted RNA binding protein YcfA (HicA-like mRNA interferase family)